MTVSPIGRAVRGSLSRRRVQTVVIGLVVLVSTCASVLGIALVADSNAPFDTAFAAQHGADVTATLAAAKATTAQLANSARLPGVSAAAGPFAEATAQMNIRITAGPAGSANGALPNMTVVGRPSPGGSVDDVSLQAGHWPAGPGQIVLADEAASSNLPPGTAVGDRVTVTSAPDRPVLTVVGLATSVTGTADAWVAPAALLSLLRPGTAASAQMLYRFARAATPAQIRADIAAVEAALPAGAVTGTQSYLSVRAQESSGIAPIAPLIAAFGVIGLIMAVLIVVNVITGAVVAGYQRIGILKSIGFTPRQVTVAYMAQALVPAILGCLAGLALGNVMAGALLNRAAQVYQVGALGVPAWVNLTIPVSMLLVVAIAALLPAARAGRLSAIQAIAAGRAPRAGRGYAAHRLMSRLRLPRPVGIGLAAPFARPARTAVTLVSVLLGAAAVTFAVGLGSSLSGVVTGLRLSNTEQVQAWLPPTPAATARGASVLTAAIRAQPGTLHYVAEFDEQVHLPGMTQLVPVTAYQGQSAWLGYDLISGRWFTAPGQVDVPTYFLTVTGKSVGDDVSFTYGGRLISARIVGEVFSSDNNGMAMFADWRTLAGTGARPVLPTQYDIGLRPGTSADAYARSLGNAVGQAYQVGQNPGGKGLPIVLGLISLLTLLIASVAGLGVLNTVVLQTRERVHDLGVFKAIGMTPRQTIAMVLSWVTGTGLVAGVLAVPIGIALQHHLVPVVGEAAGTAIPAVIINVYRGPEIAVLALAGIVIAAAGALAPATWAAGARTASALRAE